MHCHTMLAVWILLFAPAQAQNLRSASSSTTNTTAVSNMDVEAERRILQPTSTNPTFLPDHGLIVMNAESVPITSPWKLENNVTGFTGPGFIRFDGNELIGGSPQGMLSYFFQIDQPGSYKLVMRVRKNADVGHQANDCYVRVPGQPGYLGEIKKAFMPGRLPRNAWRWATQLEVNHDAGFFPEPVYNFQSGTYELQVWGRSKMFYIDRIVLFKIDAVKVDYARALSRAESRRVGGVGGNQTAPPTTVRLTKLELVTAGVANYTVVQELKDGDVIDQKIVGSNLSIIAHVNGEVWRMMFQYNGMDFTDTVAPFSMRGDTLKTKSVNVVPFLSTVGKKTVQITGNVPDGQSIGSTVVSFTII